MMMNSNQIILENTRLQIRKFSASDLSALYSICSDAELMKYVGTGEPLTINQVEKWLEVTRINYATKGFGNYALIFKENQELIGYCGLVYSKEIDDIELIYALRKSYWGKGLATEASKMMIDFAFDSIKLEQVFASIDPANIGSEKILIKTGFIFAFEQTDEWGLPTKYFSIPNPF